MARPWFGVKTYGIGLSPTSPAGWIALAVFVAATAISTSVLLSLGAPPWAAALAVLAIAAGFVVVIMRKSDGQPWRWRWGGR